MRRKTLLGLLFLVSSCQLLSSLVYGLSLKEAIILARKHLPSFKASWDQVQSTRSLYKATLSPYLPSLDFSGIHQNNDSKDIDDSRQYDVTLSYLLFDGGRRRANRNIARLNLDSDWEELRKNLLNLQFSVKIAFYNSFARKEILEQRVLQFKDAQKDYEVALGRKRAGVDRRSAVLQAAVRYEQARFDLRRSQGDLTRSMSDLNSLIGRDLDTPFDLQGVFTMDRITLPAKEHLNKVALQRPVLQQTRNVVQITNNAKSLSESLFYPDFTIDFSYVRTNIGNVDTGNKAAALNATWNIFEWGKFYERKASISDIEVAQEKLDEVKRNVLLEIQTLYEDFLTARESLAVAGQQLKEAEFNYEQAFGEYKVGKGNILSLVQAESFLADARLQFTTSKLDLAVVKASLEQAAGVENLETMQMVEVP